MVDNRDGQRPAQMDAPADEAHEHPGSGVPFTSSEYLAILQLAIDETALIFWTRGNHGDIQPLLLPVDAAWMHEH